MLAEMIAIQVKINRVDINHYFCFCPFVVRLNALPNDKNLAPVDLYKQVPG